MMPGRRCRTAAPVSLLNPDPGGIFEVLNTSIPWAAFFDRAPGRGGGICEGSPANQGKCVYILTDWIDKER